MKFQYFHTNHKILLCPILSHFGLGITRSWPCILGGVKSNLLNRQNLLQSQKELWRFIVYSYWADMSNFSAIYPLVLLWHLIFWRVWHYVEYENKNDFRSLIKHYFLRSKTEKETKENLDKYYGANSLSDYTVKYWFREFCGGFPHSQYLSDLAPSDYYLVPNLKRWLTIKSLDWARRSLTPPFFQTHSLDELVQGFVDVSTMTSSFLFKPFVGFQRRFSWFYGSG